MKRDSTLCGKYRHYKGNLYEVIGIAYHTETLEELVVYKALSDQDKLWVRPKTMFFEEVIYEGKSVPRFILLHLNIY